MMKHFLTMILAAAVLSGCMSGSGRDSSVNMPTDPKPQTGKYSVQVVQFELPYDLAVEVMAILMHQSNEGRLTKKGETPKTVDALFADRLFHLSDAAWTEYPVVYATKGETAVNDQTEALNLPVDYTVVNGKPVVSSRLTKLGRLVEVELLTTDPARITCRLKAYSRTLVGNDIYQLENGDTVEIPMLEGTEINTIVSQSVGSWTTLGGIQKTGKPGDPVSMSRVICVRILPPPVVSGS